MSMLCIHAHVVYKDVKSTTVYLARPEENALDLTADPQPSVGKLGILYIHNPLCAQWIS